MIIVYNDDNDVLYQLIADKVYRHLALEGNAIVELDFLNETQMCQLNMQQRNINKPTDVLSFPFLNKIEAFTKQNYPKEFDSDNDAVMLGNIVICPEVAHAQASNNNNSPVREKCFLFLHGLLHLLGYDHETDEDMEKMREIESCIMDSTTIA